MNSEQIYSAIEFPDDFELRQDALDDLSRKINEASINVTEALASFSPSADQYQKLVIEATQNTIRLVAPAGSGKTQTIVNRVLMQVKHGVSAKRILVLTFDNSAAGSLKAKLEEQIQKTSSLPEAPRISTLNAFGYGLLREYIPREYKSLVTEVAPLVWTVSASS